MALKRIKIHETVDVNHLDREYTRKQIQRVLKAIEVEILISMTSATTEVSIETDVELHFEIKS